jgi:uncharacterized protein (TIGR03435 family)
LISVLSTSSLPSRRSFLLRAAACSTFFGLAEIAKAGAAIRPAETAEDKPLEFEVISIRPSKPGAGARMSWVTTPDGYVVTGQSLRTTILIAYIPQMALWKGRLQGGPDWLNDPYDIIAKVDAAELPEWQKQGLGLDQKEMLRAMLCTMLAERCKLVLHRTPVEAPAYALVTGKHGAKLTQTKPDATLPETGMKLPSGGMMQGYGMGDLQKANTFSSATMADLAAFFSLSIGLSTGRPVVDRTGLTGKFDFALPKRDNGDSTDEPDPTELWDLEALGLKLEPMKVLSEVLVIDHIEKPSPN